MVLFLVISVIAVQSKDDLSKTRLDCELRLHLRNTVTSFSIIAIYIKSKHHALLNSAFVTVTAQIMLKLLQNVTLASRSTFFTDMFLCSNFW